MNAGASPNADDALNVAIDSYAAQSRALLSRVRWLLGIVLVMVIAASAFVFNESFHNNASINTSVVSVSVGMILVLFWIALLCIHDFNHHKASIAVLRSLHISRHFEDVFRATITKSGPAAAIDAFRAKLSTDRHARRRQIDRRVEKALSWVSATVGTIAQNREGVRLLLDPPKNLIDNDYRNRLLIEALTHLLLFSGIVVTFIGLFHAFSDNKLWELYAVAAKGQADEKKFKEVIDGFLLAFGATAVGYVSYLSGRYMSDLVAQDSLNLATLLDVDLMEAFRRSLSPLASEKAAMPAITGEVTTIAEEMERLLAANEKSLKVMLDGVRQIASEANTVTAGMRDALKEMKAGAAEAADHLRKGSQEWKGAAETWVAANDRVEKTTTAIIESFGQTTQGVLRSTHTVITEAENTARAATASANEMRSAASAVSASLITASGSLNGAAGTVERALTKGINVIVRDTAGHVAAFDSRLMTFAQHVAAQVNQFTAFQNEVTLGREELLRALNAGQQQSRERTDAAQQALIELAREAQLLRQGVGEPIRGMQGDLHDARVRLQRMEEVLRLLADDEWLSDQVRRWAAMNREVNFHNGRPRE